ncbi:hypothetical protein [Deinococcus ficus]|uniref:Uncharacterized protein n=2 Tax=Deinococcus ficus TaxID=317577 RepID=A0A221STF0_9DEIO|nr:hypothetical protein [Deinococcus ficus]ASN79914.1 hypothetical protein DFI_01860 [Deinococcus ficus]
MEENLPAGGPTDMDDGTVTLQFLQLSVRALAQPASVQVISTGHSPIAGDELAIDFDSWYVPALRDGCLEDCQPSQLAALKRLDATLADMTQLQDQKLWLTDALFENHWWSRVRAEARQVIELMSWPEDPPEPPLIIHVPD